MGKLRHTAALMTAIVVAFSFIGVYLVLDNLTSRASEGRADRTDLRNELGVQEQKTTILAKQLEALGETPVVSAPKTSALPPTNVRYIPIPGPRGLLGPPGKSIKGAKGEAGITGLPGLSIKGDKGDTGSDSTVPGPTGPGPTDAQIAQAVADYCAAHDGCKGAPAPLVPTP